MHGQVCFCSGSNVTIRSCQSSQRQVTWKAHEGVVLKVDWSPINHMVVTGGEDCKYKVRGLVGVWGDREGCLGCMSLRSGMLASPHLLVEG